MLILLIFLSTSIQIEAGLEPTTPIYLRKTRAEVDYSQGPSRTQGTLKVSCICVTKGMEPPSRMKTAFRPKPFSKADCAFLKMGLVYGATQGFPVLRTSNLQ